MSTEVWDELVVQVALMGDADGLVALVVAEAYGIGEPLLGRVVAAVVDGCWARGVEVAPEDVVVHVTHTHYAPAVLDGMLDRMGAIEEAAQDRLVVAAEAAAGAAAADVVPVRLAHARSSVGIGVNRRLWQDEPHPHVRFAPNRVEDHSGRLDVVRLDAVLDGAVRGLLVLHATHPVTMGAAAVVSGDWPGAARRRLDVACDRRAVILQGCAGDVRADVPREDDFGFTNGDRAAMEAKGEAVAAAATEALATAMEVAGGGCLLLRDAPALPFEPLPPRATLAAWADGSEEPHMHEAARQRWAAATLADLDAGAAPPQALPWAMTLLDWGGLFLLSVAGEPVHRLGDAWLDQLEADGAIGLVLGYSDGVPGYLPDARVEAEGGYEAGEVSSWFYRWPGRLVPPAASPITARLASWLGRTEEE